MGEPQNPNIGATSRFKNKWGTVKILKALICIQRVHFMVYKLCPNFHFLASQIKKKEKANMYWAFLSSYNIPT